MLAAGKTGHRRELCSQFSHSQACVAARASCHTAAAQGSAFCYAPFYHTACLLFFLLQNNLLQQTNAVPWFESSHQIKIRPVQRLPLRIMAVGLGCRAFRVDFGDFQQGVVGGVNFGSFSWLLQSVARP